MTANGLGTISLRNPFKAAVFHVSGTGNIIRNIYHSEGLIALWKGVGPLVVGVMPARAINFAVYTSGKQFYTQLNGNRETPMVHMLAGLSAGVVTATFTNPIWVVKTRLQLQEKAYKNSLDCITTLLRNEGYRGFYRGISASYLGTLEGALQWIVYERLKKTFKIDSESTKNLSHKDSRNWHRFFAVGVIAKLTAAIVTYPHEVLRTRLRQENVHYRGIMDCARKIFAQEGTAAFYGGLTPHLLRVVPNSAILFLCYELLIHIL